MNAVKPLILHLPFIGMLLILGFFVLADVGYLAWFRSESTYAWTVMVWYPLCALLGLTQAILWIRWIINRGNYPRKFGALCSLAFSSLVQRSCACSYSKQPNDGISGSRVDESAWSVSRFKA